ncbi:MAG: ketoacyl-ACP synthase III [Spirochaetales bacterium]|nr:ketoacyl-ACP synthase III [Spirochaetales bacterium]
MGIYIVSIGVHIPEKIITNDDLSETLDTSDEWIYSHTGIKRRHIAGEHEFASDMAVSAAQKALEKASMAATDIDMIIVATSTPDYLGYPSTASLVQDRIGAKPAAALDVSAACSGFVYGLETARGMILGKTAKNVLVIGSEINSRILNWKDRNTCVLFGDGAGAVILSEDVHISSGIMKTILKAEGDGSDSLMIKAGGIRYPFDSEGTAPDDRYIYMDGRRVYNFAVRANTELIKDLLASENLSYSDLKYIVPHQANIRIIQAAAARLKLPESLFFSNMEEYANTSAASIPIALNEMVNKNLLSRGDILMFLGFGAGLTYGGTLLRW